MKGRVLIIAGSDPSGGAGIQADIKTVTALGGYAATAITALTVQNTTGVSAVHQAPFDVIADQIDAVIGDIGVDAVKIGMIGAVGVVDLIVEKLRAIPAETPVVVDPVLSATSGDALAEDGVGAAIRDRLAPLATVITPNTIEAAALTGLSIASRRDMEIAGDALRKAGATAALVKGGHMSGDRLFDALVTDDGVHWFEHPRIETTSTHGTGCTLASAIAAGLAQDLSFFDATARGVRYVQAAIKTAPGFGAGAGPLNHAHVLTPTPTRDREG